MRGFAAHNLLLALHQRRKAAALALFCADDCEHSRAAFRALTLFSRFAILHGYFLGVFHLAFIFAFHTVVKLLCHDWIVSLRLLVNIDIYPLLWDILHAPDTLHIPVIACPVGSA